MTRDDFETHKSGTFKKLNLAKANRQEIRNHVGQILERCETLKKQPPGQRYAHADEIARTARLIRAVIDVEENADADE